MQRVRAAISLGPNCRGKHHLLRVFGDASPSGVFDWQVTPPEALQCYLRQDFAGLFEREDLVVKEGVVWNARYRTSHQHEFPRGLTAAELDAHYPAARARHEHLCRRTRSRLRGRGPLLLVFSRPVPGEVVAGVRAAVSRYNPRLTFHLVAEPPEGAVGDWTGSAEVWDALLAPFRIGPLDRLRAGAAGAWRRRFGRRAATRGPIAPA
ncbi:hypothetical protein [Devosia sp. A16]|uniref:hypothetical protein n=1 Tax=Devosia sp. A16 TaxID=1736675 RepID=UPI000ADA17E1|nr:hypothetical protein [Devosia sp. A16]